MRKRAAAIGLAVTLITGFEGVKLTAYRDPVGIPTVCMGETRGVKIGDTYTLEQCKAMAAGRVAEFAAGVDAALKVPVSDKTFASFVSFSYNLGVDVFAKRIAPLANAGSLTQACRKMGEYVYAKGVRLPGLVNRRREEVNLCLEGLR